MRYQKLGDVYISTVISTRVEGNTITLFGTAYLDTKISKLFTWGAIAGSKGYEISLYNSRNERISTIYYTSTYNLFIEIAHMIKNI